jgi:hypothetical protein
MVGDAPWRKASMSFTIDNATAAAHYAKLLRSDQVVGEAFRMTCEPPAEYGVIVERSPLTYMGYPAERLRFGKHHEAVTRLTIKVKGHDT